MNRDSGSEQPGQRTVAELLAEYGGDSSGKTGTRRRRRRAEDPTETAPHAIIDRVLSDSGTMRPVDANGHPVSPNAASGSSPAAHRPASEQPQAAQQSAPEQPSASQQPSTSQQPPAAGQPSASQRPPAAQEPPQATPGPQSQPPAPQQPGATQQAATQQQQPVAPPQPAQPQGGQPPAAAQQHGTAPTAEPQPSSQPPGAQTPPAPAPQRPAPSGPPPPAPNAAPPGRQPEAPAQADAGEAPANHAPDSEAPSANVWAQRFAAAAGGSKQASSAQASAPAQPDEEQTTRQPPVHPGAAQPGQQYSGHTEQIPRVDTADQEGTAVVPVPQNDPYAAGDDLPRAAEQDFADPYGGQATEQSFGDTPGYDDAYAGADEYSDLDGYADEYDDQYVQDYDEFDEFDEYAHDRPAGMGADDPDDEHDQAASPGREWATFVAQTGACLVGGGLLWLGFRWLWIAIPVAALVAALVVTGALVLVARKVVRGDDLQTVLLAVLVGLVCTVSPAALLLIGQ